MRTAFKLSFILSCMVHASLSNASVEIIGEGAKSVREKENPALCKVEIQVQDQDGEGLDTCSGTLVGSNEIATGGHCFKRDFELSNAQVTVTCGGKSHAVVKVELPPRRYWMDENRPYPAYDYARVTLKKPAPNPLRRAKDESSYFNEDGSVKPQVRCWVAGYGVNPRGGVGSLYVAELSAQRIAYSGGMVQVSDPQGKDLRVSVDHGDSGGSFYCQAENQPIELVGVTVSYQKRDQKDSHRLTNNFAAIWLQTLF